MSPNHIGFFFFYQWKWYAKFGTLSVMTVRLSKHISCDFYQWFYLFENIQFSNVSALCFAKYYQWSQYQLSICNILSVWLLSVITFIQKISVFSIISDFHCFKMYQLSVVISGPKFSNLISFIYQWTDKKTAHW